jgi:tetratricopeptide (TPR) repeat protein
MCWWITLGFAPFEEGKGGFPRTGQVIKYYRQRKRDDAGNAWTQKRMGEVLEITEKTVSDIENRDATLDLDRRQLLCQLFAIPTCLLGIRNREDIDLIVEQERAKNAASAVLPITPPATVWWVELGYAAFAAGSEDFLPNPGQVIKHYRGQKLDNKGKPWTQRLLAQTLGVTDQAVWDLENRDSRMDNCDRRQFLSELFGIPPLLLGIITLEEILKMVEEKGATQPMPPVPSTVAKTSHKLLIDREEYTTLLNRCWTTFTSDPVHSSITDVEWRIDTLYRELPHLRNKKPLYELLCRYHDFVANVLRDQQHSVDAIQHCTKALRFAKQLHSAELTALVLYDLGYVLWQAGCLNEARHQYEEALRYEQGLPNNLRGCLLLDAGCTGALTAKTQDVRNEAIALVDRVGNMIRSNPKEADPYFLTCNLDGYHLRRSLSLMAIGRNRDAIDELQLVNAGAEYPRRQAKNDIYQAQAHSNLGEYDRVVALAEAGLEVAEQIGSEMIIALVENIFQQLKESVYKDSPDVARLDYLLRKRRSKK